MALNVSDCEKLPRGNWDDLEIGQKQIDIHEQPGLCSRLGPCTAPLRLST